VIERRIALVFVIDPQGRVLMQHRSAEAAVSPNQWTMPGGKIEEGEEPIDAAIREVFEETGLTVDQLEPIWSGTRPSVKNHYGIVEVHAFGATTSACQEDIVLGEGQAMIFLSPEQARARDLGVTAKLVLAPFLDSEAYQRLFRKAALISGSGKGSAVPDERRKRGAERPKSTPVRPIVPDSRAPLSALGGGTSDACAAVSEVGRGPGLDGTGTD
jgi:8-oxo-dGTP pyrophosphatase MutT (NUDIX family)